MRAEPTRVPDADDEEHEFKVRRAAQRQGYSLVVSRPDFGLYSLRDVFTTVVENKTLNHCEAWLATPVGGDVDATAKRLRANR
ncbi:MAG: hypothetical protein ABIQ73_29890 [Acidimicrobiales bacterium]